MMQTATAASLMAGIRLRDPAVFSLLLLFATAFPPLFMIAGCELFPSQTSVFQPGLTALAFLGGGHVAITFWFYVDRRARDVFSTAKLYYYLTPLLIMGATCGLYVWLSPDNRKYAYALFALSAQWHHARQNIGVYSALSQAWKLGRVSPVEKSILSLSWLGGVCAGIRWYGLPLSDAVFNGLYYLGAAIYVLIFAVALYYGLKDYREHRRPTKTILFLGLCLFFLPAFLFRTPAAAASFGAAHAVQYYLFMWYVIYRSPAQMASKLGLPGSRAGWIAALAVSALWPTLILFVLSDAYLKLNASVGGHLNGGVDTAVFGIIMGWVMTHYLIDARVWRLGDPKVRQYHFKAFAFLR